MRTSGAMHIQELIQELAAVKEEHGNLPVTVCNTHPGQDPFEPVVAVGFTGKTPTHVEILDKKLL